MKIPLFMFVKLCILLSTVELLSGCESSRVFIKNRDDGLNSKSNYQGILKEQIISTQKILQSKEKEYQHSGTKETSNDLMEKAIKKKAEGLFQKGYEYYLKQKFPEAIAVFKEALAIYPQHQKAGIYLNESQLAFAKEEQAESSAQREQQKKEEELRLKIIEDAKTKQTQYHYFKGVYLLKEGHYKDAAEEFSKVLLIEPDYVQAKNLMVEAMAKTAGKEGIESELKDNFDLAIKHIENNEYNQANEELSLILKRIEEMSNAYEQKSVFLAISKEAEKSSGKVINYIHGEEYAQAKEEINKLLNEVSTLSEKEKSRKREKDIAEAVNGLFNSALDLIDKGNYKGAKTKLERILEIAPENKDAKSLLERIKEVLIISGSN